MHVTFNIKYIFLDNTHDNVDCVTNASIVTTNILLYMFYIPGILFFKIRIYILVHQLKRTLDLNICKKYSNDLFQLQIKDSKSLFNEYYLLFKKRSSSDFFGNIRWLCRLFCYPRHLPFLYTALFFGVFPAKSRFVFTECTLATVRSQARLQVIKQHDISETH